MPNCIALWLFFNLSKQHFEDISDHPGLLTYYGIYFQLESSGEEQWRPGSAGSGSGASGGGKFRRLQLKWELLSNADSSPQTPSGKARLLDHVSRIESVC